MGTEKEKNGGNVPPPKNVPPKEKTVPNTLLRTFFCWMLPIFYYGNTRDLEEYDLPPPKSKYQSKKVGDILER